MAHKQRRDEKVILLVAKNIRKYRLERSLTIQQLAHMIDNNKDLYGQISKMERGIVNPTISMINIIADTLEVKLTDLFTEDTI